MGSFDMYGGTIFFIAIYLFANTYCLEDTLRDPKLSIFQVVKFQNTGCTGSSRNGTCFTAAECSNLGGTQDQTCADGFGVCCIVSISSGGTSNVNSSYIVAGSTDLTTGGHDYTICPCSNDICRIRFDFTTFVLTGPVTASTIGKNANAIGFAGTTLKQGSVGDCTEDQFSITGNSAHGSPIVCGTNTGDHMIVDANGSECVVASFGIGAASTTTRSAEILVTQYRCGDLNGGPPGCLQYFTETSGRIKGFNFPTQASATTVSSDVVHLSNQDYEICIRRGSGLEYICYIACTSVAAAGAGTNIASTAQASFGLSTSPSAAIAQGSVGTNCSTDYIVIPGGMLAAIALSTTSFAVEVAGKYCGRAFGAEATEEAAITISVCTNQLPFKVGVHTDEDEKCSAPDSAVNCEMELAPGGIVGFCLNYVQTSSA